MHARVGCVFALVLCHGSLAHAGIEDWQVNEIVTSAGGSSQIRYVELFNAPGGCLFASTRVFVYDASGAPMGSTTLVPSTTCFGPDSYFVVTTPEAAGYLGTNANHQGLPGLPQSAGQVCFSSTSTRYDCVRWGVIDVAVTDLYGSQDLSATAAANDSEALTRIATTHVVIDDWQTGGLTPHGPNNGTPWTPPETSPIDAGPTPDSAVGDVDAGMSADGGVTPDAGTAAPDAGMDAPDAQNTRFLDLDPTGGASCGCRADRPSTGPGASGVVMLLAAAVLLARRRRRVSLG